MINTILTNHTQNKVGKAVATFTCHHPYVAFFAPFVVMPILMLIAVFAGTTAIMFPISWIMGWL